MINFIFVRTSQKKRKSIVQVQLSGHPSTMITYVFIQQFVLNIIRQLNVDFLILWNRGPGSENFILKQINSSVQFLAQSCPTLCNAMNCRTPGLPVHHQLLEFIPPNHLILGRPLLLLPSIIPSIRVFSNESTLHIRWPKY